VDGDHQPAAEQSRSPVVTHAEFLSGGWENAPGPQIRMCAVNAAQGKTKRRRRVYFFRNAL
jgi:hypothetical protein